MLTVDASQISQGEMSQPSSQSTTSVLEFNSPDSTILSSSPACYGSPTPDYIRRTRWYIPICSDGALGLRHTYVYVLSNQSEDDGKTFERLQLAYSQCRCQLYERFFYKLDTIHRAQVTYFPRIKLIYKHLKGVRYR
jgi:hypothetical protein